MRFTLVIPAFNEAPVIGRTLAALSEAFRRDASFDWDIIVADNGSTDGTGEIVRQMGDKRIRVLIITEQGKGNALRAAFGETQNAIVGFTDADLPVSPEEIIAAVSIVSEGSVDVVAGSRLLPASDMPDREWWRTTSSRVFNGLARMLVGVGVSDSQCPLKVMNAKGRALLLATVESTWFLDLEFFALAEREGLRIREVPVVWNEHRYPDRKSKLSATDTLRAVLAMLRIRNRLSVHAPRL